ncbi:hypothetical protein [Phyllobacterium endophyticum]|uniref:EF-hand domain-containing protein n=1 Tax=Phyllobacterium endophyticum TaxID=1149773 RepID=A0A2P7B037_9HYPH|nr:hypothetical protein [Phyllobacterium endophyticum]MBB3235526.1 hypothetical protein [Phyllobacterium endophyticum]PSH59835.1 hypothetical protein CU100_03495 [Phyllobacterium endophyticum]TYR41985.1 hypothetical protein FY050_12105 [Phyllobacterium endophyticum]
MAISRTIIIALLFTVTAGYGHAGDRVWDPEPGAKTQKQDAASIQKLLDKELRAKFDAAAKSNHLLTAKGAKDAGWGVIVDHYDEIDRDSDGYLTFDEVQTFFDARSPLATARARAAAKVQVVE